MQGVEARCIAEDESIAVIVVLTRSAVAVADMPIFSASSRLVIRPSS